MDAIFALQWNAIFAMQLYFPIAIQCFENHHWIKNMPCRYLEDIAYIVCKSILPMFVMICNVIKKRRKLH